MHDLAADTGCSGLLNDLKKQLASELYGCDLQLLDGDQFIGEPARTFVAGPNRGLSLTRGSQWPVPPVNPKGDMDFFPEAPDSDATNN